jgi:hypothetical protein
MRKWGAGSLHKRNKRLLMQALHRSRCLLHSPRLLQIRSLRTYPRDIPTYIKGWDPTLHKSLLLPKPLLQPEPPSGLGSDGSEERKALRDAHMIAIQVGGAGVRQRETCRKLNYLLKLAHFSSDQDISLRAPLWRAYRMAKYADSKLLSRISDLSWDLLWTMQSIESPNNRSRKKHMRELYHDMRSVDKLPRAMHGVQFLEKLFLSGEEDLAMQLWEEGHSLSLEEIRQEHKPQHLEMGAKLYALAGNTDRAKDIMDELFHLYPDWNPSVMMAVFRAHTSSDSEKHHDTANDIYIMMKKRSSATATLEDYDAWLIGFMEARHLRYAIQVFQDMVRDGYLATSGMTERVGDLLKRLHMLYRLGTDISSMTSIALGAISVLPLAYHGHLFGDWMKSTVVQKAPEAAAQVLDMMFKRGYKPETFHFNMLLQALIRTKEDTNVLKAENIGWRMIDESRVAHKEELELDTTAERINDRQHRDSQPSIKATPNLPSANVTTFALMMQHHAKSLQWEHVDYLSRRLKETSIIPNATIMNVLIDNKCRQGAYAEAWSIYTRLTSPSDNSDTGVFPNGATFRFLWKTLRLALGDHATRDDPNLPSPRELLKETVEWWNLCRSRYDADRFKQGLAAADHGAITALVMHCFSYTQDVAGSLVALHVLRQKFEIFPTNRVADILTRQMAWVDQSHASQWERSQYFHSRSNKRKMERIGRVYQILLQQRHERLNLSDEEIAKLTTEQLGDVGLNLLSEFVRVVMKRTHPPEVVEVMIEAATRAVGCRGMRTGDMNAFEVA